MIDYLKNSILGLSLKILILGALDAGTIWAGIYLFLNGGKILAGALVTGVLVINWIFLWEKTYPIRYMVPGLIFVFAFIVYPIGYTVYISFTNYGGGHLLSKEQAIDNIESQYYQPKNPMNFTFNAYKNEQGDIKLILTARQTDEVYLTGGTKLNKVDLTGPRFVDKDGDGTIDSFNGYTLMSRMQLIQALDKLQDWHPEREGLAVKMTSLSQFDELIPLYEYQPAQDQIVNKNTGEVFVPKHGTFVSTTSNKTLSPGFKTTLGFHNYLRIFTDPLVSGPFFRVFTWTFIWAFLTVLTTFALGLGAALILNDRGLRFSSFYKGIFILPYAIPAFISALMWRGFFNTNVGVINTKILEPLFGLSVPWFQDPLMAKIAVLLVNLWLGFPYMMIICLGALQSIQPELYEVARVDGATAFQQFKNITFPLLMMSVAPLLIGSFAFNFNNFNVIYLVTRGDPPIVGATTAGSTDILISYTYKLAFQGEGSAHYGFAAAISIVIFLIIATISAINFRYTGALEELSENV